MHTSRPLDTEKAVVLGVKDKTMVEGWGSEITPFCAFLSSPNRKTDTVVLHATVGAT
jgi:hypothetical protein